MQISIHDARPGMVLSDDIEIGGQTLLNKMEILDDTLITLLQNTGLSDISVFTPDNISSPQEIDPAHTSTLNKTTPAHIHTTDKSVSNKKAAIPSEIHITVSPDHMSAHLSLDPVTSPETIPTSQTILDALDAYGIVYGINTILVDETAAHWKEEQASLEVSGIATGDPARSKIKGDPEMIVKHLTTQAECTTVQQLKQHAAVLNEFPSVEIVSSGSPIAKIAILQKASVGTDIFGNQIFSQETTDTSNLNLTDNTIFNDKNDMIEACTNGVAFKIDSTIGVIPLDFDGFFTIEISPDKMKAFCRVTPPGLNGTMPDKQALLNQIKRSSVHFGIDEGAIDSVIALCHRNKYPDEPMIIARGLPPENGKNGDYLFHFSTETSFAPAINSDGSADYKSLNIVTTVHKDQELVSLIPPGKGHDGSDVLGKIIPAQDGTPARLPRGSNTSIHPQKPSVLIADIEGIVRLAGGGLVEVCEGFLVNGNVDYSTGNIDYNKTIQITGDVKSGFNIHAGGDLQVNGTVEDSIIKVGGNMLCRCGFLGQGKGCIEAKGDVNLSFIKNQCVRSFHAINVAKESINAILYSRSSIYLHGRPLSIAGGEVHAKNSITVYAVGNHTGIKTILEVGTDFLMVNELDMIEHQISETTAEFKAVADTFTRYQKNYGKNKKLSSSEMEKLKELTKAFKQTRQKLSVLEERKSIIEKKMYNISDARITIQHNAYPGTLLKFGDRHHLLKEELIGPKTIVYTDHDIAIC